MKKVITVIVQTTSDCNLNCGYCYVRASRIIHRSRDKVFLQNIEKVIHNCVFEYDRVKFDWHGGEPLLMGIDFYKDIVRAQKRLTNSYGVEFRNTIQTNGTLLTNDYLRFFADNNFTIGVSFDGSPEVSIKTRFNRTGINSQDFICDISERIKSAGFPLCMLCVVSKQNVTMGEEIFKFFLSLGVSSYSFLPLMELPRVNYLKMPSNKELFELYKTTFELWLSPLNSFKTIEPITTIVQSLISGKTPDLCSFSSSCLRQMATITPEGNVVQCGSLIANELILGNIYESPLIKILSSQKSRNLRKIRTDAVKEYCVECEFVSICRGGCRESAYWYSGKYNGAYPFCEARKETFQYIKKRLETIFSKAR